MHSDSMLVEDVILLARDHPELAPRYSLHIPISDLNEQAAYRLSKALSAFTPLTTLSFDGTFENQKAIAALFYYANSYPLSLRNIYFSATSRPLNITEDGLKAIKNYLDRHPWVNVRVSFNAHQVHHWDIFWREHDTPLDPARQAVLKEIDRINSKNFNHRALTAIIRRVQDLSPASDSLTIFTFMLSVSEKAESVTLLSGAVTWFFLNVLNLGADYSENMAALLSRIPPFLLTSPIHLLRVTSPEMLSFRAGQAGKSAIHGITNSVSAVNAGVFTSTRVIMRNIGNAVIASGGIVENGLWVAGTTLFVAKEVAKEAVKGIKNAAKASVILVKRGPSLFATCLRKSENQKQLSISTSEQKETTSPIVSFAAQSQVDELKQRVAEQEMLLSHTHIQMLVTSDKNAFLKALQLGYRASQKEQQLAKIGEFPLLHAYYLALQLYLNQIYNICRILASRQFEPNEGLVKHLKTLMHTIPVVGGFAELLMGFSIDGRNQLMKTHATRFISIAENSTAAEKLFEQVTRYFILMRSQVLNARLEANPTLKQNLSRWFDRIKQTCLPHFLKAEFSLATELWNEDIFWEVVIEGELLFKAVVDGECKLDILSPLPEKIYALLALLGVTEDEVKQLEQNPSPQATSLSSQKADEKTTAVTNGVTYTQPVAFFQQTAAPNHKDLQELQEKIRNLEEKIQAQQSNIAVCQRQLNLSQGDEHSTRTELRLSAGADQLQVQINLKNSKFPREIAKSHDHEITRLREQVTTLTETVAALNDQVAHYERKETLNTANVVTGPFLRHKNKVVSERHPAAIEQQRQEPQSQAQARHRASSPGRCGLM